MAGDAEDGFLVARDFSAFDELLCAGDGDAAGGLGEDAGVLGEEFDALDDFIVRHVLGGAAGLAHDVDGVVAVGGRADGEGLGDRVGLRHGLHDVGAFFHGVRDRCAAGGLCAEDRKWRFVHEANFCEFAVGLVDFREERTGGHRDDGVARDAPAELLHDFKAHALAAFGVIRAQVHVHEAPAVFAGDFGAETVHLIVGAVDADDVRAVHERAEHFALLEVGGDEDVAFQSGARGVGSDGVCEVSSRGAGDDFEAQLLRAAEGDAHDAILEREGGVVDGVVLDVERLDAELLGEAIRLHERREADLRADGGLAINRQQLAVAPHALRARLDEIAREHRLDGVVVVRGLEGAEVEIADVDGLFRVEASALAALEVREVGRCVFLHGYADFQLFPEWRGVTTNHRFALICPHALRHGAGFGTWSLRRS